MAQFINEAKRFQKLAGLINEAEEAQAAAAVEKIEDKVVDSPKLEDSVENLTDEQKAELMKKLNSLGITADSNPQDVINKLQPRIDEILGEAEGGDTKMKVANTLSDIGGGLVKSLLIPIIPLAVGSAVGIGFAGGLVVTVAVAGLLIGLAKVLGVKENSTQYGNN